MTDWFKIIYKPRSILGLLMGVGLLFIFFSGIAMPIHPEVSTYFDKWGRGIFVIGLAGWLLYILPAILQRWDKLLGK